MRILSVLVATAALFAATAPAAAASRADWDACKGDDDLDRSIAACTRIIQGRGDTAKDSAIAHHERGLSYKSKGDFDRAIADFTEAIRLDPKYAEAYYIRGVAYGNKGDLDRAIADYSEAIRLDPKLAAAYNNRGNAYKNKGDLDRAITDYSEAIRLAPGYDIAYFNRGRAYYLKRDFDRAIADYTESLRINPQRRSSYVDRCLVYFAKRDNARAISDRVDVLQNLFRRARIGNFQTKVLVHSNDQLKRIDRIQTDTVGAK